MNLNKTENLSCNFSDRALKTDDEIIVKILIQQIIILNTGKKKNLILGDIIQTLGLPGILLETDIESLKSIQTFLLKSASSISKKKSEIENFKVSNYDGESIILYASALSKLWYKSCIVNMQFPNTICLLLQCYSSVNINSLERYTPDGIKYEDNLILRVNSDDKKNNLLELKLDYLDDEIKCYSAIPTILVLSVLFLIESFQDTVTFNNLPFGVAGCYIDEILIEFLEKNKKYIYSGFLPF